jgi:hypothetical protein
MPCILTHTTKSFEGNTQIAHNGLYRMTAIENVSCDLTYSFLVLPLLSGFSVKTCNALHPDSWLLPSMLQCHHHDNHNLGNTVSVQQTLT